MAYEQRDMSGALFVNDRKENERQPDYKGDAKVDGVDYWLSGWKKQTKNGDTFLSLSLERKDDAKSHGSTTTTGDDPF